VRATLAMSAASFLVPMIAVPWHRCSRLGARLKPVAV
jgi:hypothetical protein